jgi:hypothetical protein
MKIANALRVGNALVRATKTESVIVNVLALVNVMKIANALRVETALVRATKTESVIVNVLAL